MANFADILKKPAADVEKPAPFPPGTYVLQLGQMKMVEVGKDKTPAVQFANTIVDHMQDVDAAGYKDSKGALRPIKQQSFPANYVQFFITEDALFRLVDFLEEACKIEKGTKSIEQMLAEVPGKVVQVSNTHRASQDGKNMYNNANGFMAI